MKDTFGREISYLRLSVTERCNLRCRYCMPEEGICKKRHEEMLTEDEMIMAVEAAASLGFHKLRITGGEPMAKCNILSICRRASMVPGIEELCMTTNATLLGGGMAAELRKAGVQRLNISLDTLDPQKYAWITRRGSLKEAWKGIEAAMGAGFQRIKINTVLIGGFNDDEIRQLADLTMRYPVDVRFIEMMPMLENTEFGREAYIPYDRVLAELPELELAEQNGGVAKLYRLPGAMGYVGLISPVHDHFCGGCDRLRLTADGKLKPCLHSRAEYPIKGLTPEEIKEQFKKAILCKPEWHGELGFDEHSHAARRMNQIGG